MRFGHELEFVDHAHLRLIYLEVARLELLHHCLQLLLAKPTHILIHLCQSTQEAFPPRLHCLLSKQL